MPAGWLVRLQSRFRLYSWSEPFTLEAPPGPPLALSLRDTRLERVDRRLGSRRHVDLREDVADVVLHRFLAQVQLVRNLPVREPKRDEPDHFGLSLRKLRRI